jgi:hypothetical protein
MNWIKEIARDLMAFGSIPFLIIVFIRSMIGEHLIFVYQLIIAIAILILSSFIFKKINQHIARGLVLAFYTSLFYQDALFTFFAFIIFGLMIISSLYIKKDKKSTIKGVLVGILASAISYYLSAVIN